MRVAAALAVAALTAVALAAAERASGLSCARVSSLGQALRLSDAVFEGIVVGDSKHRGGAVTPGKPSSTYEGSSHRFRVARYLRGRAGSLVTVRVLPIGGFPLARPRGGEAWRVYATRDPSSDRLSFNPCVPFSKRLTGAAVARVRGRLGGDPVSGSSTGADDDSDAPLALWLAIGAVAVAAAAFLATRFRRRI
jgi:hypothetical protein